MTSEPPAAAGMPNTGGQQEFPCGSCGARLTFAPGTQVLRCPYCSHEQQVAQPARTIREHSFVDWQHLADKPIGHVGAHPLQCTGCGARTETDKLSSSCPFCGAPLISEADPEAMIVPEAVLPFAVPQNAALTAFREWINSRWFAPTSLKTLAAHEGIQGTYLPHWTFDSSTVTQYQGQRGEHYWDTETYTDTDSDGRSVTRTRQVQRTSWYPAWGTVSRHFDNVLVPAVTSLPPSSLTELEPWDLPSATAYQPEYLSGFQTLRYEVDPPDGYTAFQARARPVIKDDCRGDIGGDEQRVTDMQTAWSDVTFMLMLLPVWLAAYRYRDRVWRVMINARTGEVIGERPYSPWKIAAAVTAALLVIAVVLLVVRHR